MSVSGLPATGGPVHLTVDTLVASGEATLCLAGELDLNTTWVLEEALTAVLTQGVPKLVIDMAALEFIDSSGLNQLVMTRQRQHAQGGDVALRSPKASTRRVLEIVGLTELFTIT